MRGHSLVGFARAQIPSWWCFRVGRKPSYCLQEGNPIDATQICPMLFSYLPAQLLLSDVLQCTGKIHRLSVILNRDQRNKVSPQLPDTYERISRPSTVLSLDQDDYFWARYYNKPLLLQFALWPHQNTEQLPPIQVTFYPTLTPNYTLQVKLQLTPISPRSKRKNSTGIDLV